MKREATTFMSKSQLRTKLLNWRMTMAVLSVLPAIAWSEEIRFSDAIRNISDGGIVVETGPDEVLVFDGGVIDAGGQPLLILADTIRIDATTVILSHPLDSFPAVMEGTADKGEDAGPAGPAGPGQGGTGQTGAPGRMGAAGAPIEIEIAKISGGFPLMIIGNGQKGGEGQQGGPGGTGGKGWRGSKRTEALLCTQELFFDGGSGGTGGTGGVGGTGGTGGQGSTLRVAAPADAKTILFQGDDPTEIYGLVEAVRVGSVHEIEAQLVLASVGGRGGEGGRPGPPGAGGGGGDKGTDSRHICGRGGRAGPPGQPGVSGSEGAQGSFGVPAIISMESAVSEKLP